MGIRYFTSFTAATGGGEVIIQHTIWMRKYEEDSKEDSKEVGIRYCTSLAAATGGREVIRV